MTDIWRKAVERALDWLHESKAGKAVRLETRAIILALRAALDAAEARARQAVEAERDRTRQSMAAFVLAYQEADWDTDEPSEAARVVGLWFAKWMGTGYPTSHEHEDHSGDCTKQPWSCLRCHADDILAVVDAAIRARGAKP